MNVKKNDWVAVEYSGKISSTGEQFDSNKDRDPLKFKVGLGMVIPGFDEALVDMQEGQEKEINIPLEKAYGPKNTQIVELPKTSFQDLKQLEAGKEFVVNTNFGPMLIEIKELKEETVKAVLNHPLAGKDLLFNIKLVKILDEKEAQEMEEKINQQKQDSSECDCESCETKEDCSEKHEESEESETQKDSEKSE